LLVLEHPASCFLELLNTILLPYYELGHKKTWYLDISWSCWTPSYYHIMSWVTRRLDTWTFLTRY
jgi:hypothetical protein